MSMWFLGALIFAALGARWAVMGRARSDLAKTKAAIPGMQVAARGAFWAMLRTLVLMLVIGGALIAWQVKDVDPRDWLDRLPRPAATTRPPSDERADVSPNQRAKNGRIICFTAECARKRGPE